MTKEICIKYNSFKKFMGYGGWGIITIGIISILILSSYELHTVKYAPDINFYCYQSIIQGHEVCDNDGNHTQNRFNASIIALLIEIGFVAVWINYKKKLLKLKWCDETFSTSGGKGNQA